jgi:dephospho-CoA kinase
MKRNRERMTLVVGVTGGIGTGKTELSRMLGKLGAYIVDADMLTHEIYSCDEDLKKQLAGKFGGSVIRDGKVDRKALSGIVFADKEKLRELNSIVHGKVALQVAKEIEAGKNFRMTVLDVPIPVKKGFIDLCDVVVVVTSSMKNRIDRIVKRNSITAAEARNRIGSQMPQAEYVKIADLIIENNGDLCELESKAQDLFRGLLK